MHLQGREERVGRSREALQRRFPWPLAFVAVMFYIIGGAGQVVIGGTVTGEILAKAKIEVAGSFGTEQDRSAVRPNGTNCRQAGSLALAAVILDPDTIAPSAVVHGNRRKVQSPA